MRWTMRKCLISFSGTPSKDRVKNVSDLQNSFAKLFLLFALAFSRRRIFSPRGAENFVEVVSKHTFEEKEK